MGPLGVPNKAPIRSAPVALFFGRYFPLQTGKIGYFRPFRGTPCRAHHLPVWLMPRRLGEFPRLFRAVPGRAAGRRRRRTAFRSYCFPHCFPHIHYTQSIRRPRNECGTGPSRVLISALALRPDCVPQADPRPADADRHSRAGLARSTPPHGTHAIWHAANAACNKTELIRLLISTS